MEYIKSIDEINEKVIFEKRLDIKNAVYMKNFEGVNNCVQTAIINLLNYYNIKDENLYVTYENLKKIQNKKDLNMTTDYLEIPKILNKYFENKNINMKVNKFIFTKNNFLDYKKNINRGDVVLAHMSCKKENFGHMILVYGYLVTNVQKYLIALTGKENYEKIYIPFMGKLDGIIGYTIYPKNKI